MLDKGKVDDAQREALAAHLGMDRGTGLGCCGVNISHGDESIRARAETAGCDDANAFLRCLVGEERGAASQRAFHDRRQANPHALRTAFELTQDFGGAGKAARPRALRS